MTTPLAPWMELAACREIYGILQHLATRPLSKGHDGPVTEARDRLLQAREILAHSRRQMFDDSRLTLLSAMIDGLGRIPPEVVARTLIGPLGDLLGTGRNDAVDYPCCFVAEPGGLDIRRLVVSVGPTIGLGDEVLAARALLERARAFGGIPLQVSTRYFDLWRCQGGTICPAPPPPTGAFQAIESLTEEERGHAAFVYIDFLRTDLAPEPYAGPPGIAYGGRWVMGSTECDMVDFRQRRRHRHRYPAGLPECRWLEARWMAGRILPGPALCDPVPEPDGAPRHGKRIVLQPLTAKPGLMFPPKFYAEVFLQVSESVPDFDLQLIPSPTPKGQAQIFELLDRLRPVAPSVAVTRPDGTSLLDVYERLSSSDLLFGPDTFTAHLAALQRLPQVTISLPEHRAWRTIGSPCLSIVAHRSWESLVEPCGQAIAAFLRRSEWRREPCFDSRSRAWLGVTRRVASLVGDYLHHGHFTRRNEAADLVNETEALYREMAPAVRQITGKPQPLAPPEPFQGASFDDPHDFARALARWYHSIELTDTAAILGVN